jgi:predicted transcriptional regulator
VIPKWYHSGMAINLRIPEDLDTQLQQVADAENVSKHALLLRGARLVVERSSRRAEIDAGLEFVLSHDEELLHRLEDA